MHDRHHSVPAITSYLFSLDKYTMLPNNKHTKHKEQTDQLKTLGSLYYN